MDKAEGWAMPTAWATREPSPDGLDHSADVPIAWDFKEANAWYREDVRRRMLAEATELAPKYRTANPDMSEDEALYSAVHGAVMTIIDQLFGDEDNAPTLCASDVAWEVMYALGFHEAQAIEVRQGRNNDSPVTK